MAAALVLRGSPAFLAARIEPWILETRKQPRLQRGFQGLSAKETRNLCEPTSGPFSL